MGVLRKVVKMLRIAREATLYFILILFAVMMVVPFLYMISTAFKTLEESLRFPPTWIPHEFTIRNFAGVWKNTQLLVWIKNSAFVAVTKILAQIITCTLAAYAFSFLNFKGKNVLFICILAVLMVPQQVVIIPQFILMKKLEWINSYKALLFPHFTSAFFIFLFRQNFLTLPKEMIEASKIDGCNPINTLFRIVVPNCRPILMTMILFAFNYSWNDFMWPLIMTNSKNLMVLSIGMANMIGQFGTNWPTLMAVATYATLPVLILFMFTQRYFVEGLVSSSVKG
jgi:multiple sugar transport system permease protein